MSVGQSLPQRARIENVAIIPARGGSKGIPRKNIKIVAGRPLLSYVVTSGLDSELISRVIVSTDDSEIASVARSIGAEVVLRPLELSGDEAPSEWALLHTLETLERESGYQPDLITFLQATCPLTTPSDIDGTVQRLLEGDSDTALAVAPFHGFLWRRTPDGCAESINHDKHYRPRRQDITNQYIEVGSVYVMRAQGFREHRHRFFGRTAVHAIPPERAVDVDSPADLALAELLLRERASLSGER